MIYTVRSCEHTSPVARTIEVVLWADNGSRIRLKVAFEEANKFHVGAKYNMTLLSFDGGQNK